MLLSFWVHRSQVRLQSVFIVDFKSPEDVFVVLSMTSPDHILLCSSLRSVNAAPGGHHRYSITSLLPPFVPLLFLLLHPHSIYSWNGWFNEEPGRRLWPLAFRCSSSVWFCVVAPPQSRGCFVSEPLVLTQSSLEENSLNSSSACFLPASPLCGDYQS